MNIRDILEKKIMANFTGEFNSFDEIQKCIDALMKEAKKEIARDILRNYIKSNWEPDCANLIKYLEDTSK